VVDIQEELVAKRLYFKLVQNPVPVSNDSKYENNVGWSPDLGEYTSNASHIAIL
jgi:hypothetical protein